MSKIKQLLLLTSLCAIVISSVATQAHAQAFCQLRHPHRAQQILFPSSNGQQAFASKVSAEHRKKVMDELNFSIHHNELGLHTLYAIFNESDSIRKHLGFIHVRSEKGEWGLIEVVWALYPDLSIKGFTFQRCRELSRDEIEADAFKTFIHHKNSNDLKSYLSQRGDYLAKALPHLSIEAQPLGLRILRSALKTIAVTRIVWPELSRLSSTEKTLER